MYSCMSVRSMRLNISETDADTAGLFPIGSPQESSQGKSNGHTTDDATWPDDIIHNNSNNNFY